MTKKTIVMNVDYFDELCITDHPYGPADVEKLVQSCAESGVDTIAWRAIGLGVAGYPSRYLMKPGDLADSDMDLLMPRMAAKDRDPEVKKNGHVVLDVTNAGGYRKGMRGWGSGRIVESLKLMDPLAEARDACKRHGIKFFIWHDFLDERHNLSLLQHPQWLVTGRDGTTRFPGLRSYAVKEAVDDQLKVIDELLAYRPDGLYFATSCHNRHLNFPEPEDFFGFEEPVVQACRKAMGVDIRSQEFDVQKWHDIKGGFITDFFRRVREHARAQGAQVALGTQLGPQTILTSPVFSTHVPYRFANQWRTWIDEDLADIFVLGDYEWPWDNNIPIWEAKRMTWPDGTHAADHEFKPYVDYAKGRVQFFWFSSWLSAYAAKHAGASADSLAGAMELRTRTLLNTPADGICLHEAMTFEKEADGFDTIRRMRQEFDGAGKKS